MASGMLSVEIRAAPTENTNLGVADQDGSADPEYYIEQSEEVLQEPENNLPESECEKDGCYLKADESRFGNRYYYLFISANAMLRIFDIGILVSLPR